MLIILALFGLMSWKLYSLVHATNFYVLVMGNFYSSLINFAVTRCSGIRHINMDLYFKEDFTDNADLVQHIPPNNNRQRVEQNQEYKYTHGK